MVAPATETKVILTELTEPSDGEKPKSRRAKQNGLKRSIVFDLEKNTTLLFEYEYKDLKDEEIWFSTDDHMNMKARSRSDAREWRRQGFSILLNETFSTPRSDVQDLLNAFVQLPDKLNRRGLERQCSQRHGEERSDLKERARKLLLSTQEQCKSEGLGKLESTEKLSSCYIGACRAARVFARRLGKADEVEILRLRKLDRTGGDPDDSELVDRIMSQNGLMTPDNRRNHLVRRMSNLSVQSGNSYDSQRQWIQMTPNMGRKPEKEQQQQQNIPHSSERGETRGSRQHQHSLQSSQSSLNRSSNHSVGGGSISSSGRSSRRSRSDGGSSAGMGDDFYAAIA